MSNVARSTPLLVAALLVASLHTRPALAQPTVDETYRETARRIIAAATEDDRAYRRLEQLCDDIGHRLSGSVGLERAIEWALRCFRDDGQENVRAEPVTVPVWVRGAESLEMVEPRAMSLPMLGLGGSCGTPPEGITAEAIVVRDVDELNALGDAVRGKIVVYNFPMAEDGGRGYGTAVQYRVFGARWAIEHGAVAALVRSVTTRSLMTPHTGAMNYLESRRHIPAAAITTEHADMLARLAARDIPIRLTLKMEARSAPDAQSANVVAELRGRELPDEIVVIGAHLDSWDVGQGAHDDGGGCVTVMEALRLLRELNLRPRRTLRAVLFTNEENGLAGGRTYAREHAGDLPRHVAAVEADSGVFQPVALSIEHRDPKRADLAVEQLAGIARLLEPLVPIRVKRGGSGADIGPMKPSGVLLLGQDGDTTHYFDVHHTHADTLDKVDPRNLQQHVAMMAVTAYVLADLPDPAWRREQPAEADQAE
jgi:carboxypeptidase Q